MRIVLEPGIAHGRSDNWPYPSELESGIPVGLTMNWTFFPYTKPGETFESPQTVIHLHDGDWHAAALRYRGWYEANFTPVSADNWMRGQSGFMDTMFMLPEKNINFMFRDIPAWAESAKRCGINSVLISGWDKGGHDSDYPYYEPEPRLGTWDELKAGIDGAHRLGMRVFFFVNMQPVDVNTEMFRSLRQYAIMDPYGNYGIYGFGMGTVGARVNMTSRKMTSVNGSYPAYRRLLVDRFRRLAEIGADGVHIDKLSWGGPYSNLDFNPALEELGLSRDTAQWHGQLAFCDELLRECKAINPDFCISYEGSWDRMLQYAQNVWMWHNPWIPNHICALRYALPQVTPAYAVSQPFDYVVVNDAMRYGYQIFVGPMMYNVSMDYPVMVKLGAYIAESIRIREELMGTVYNGEFLDREQVAVQKGGDGVYYNTHRNPTTGKRACVITNSGSAAHDITICFDGNVEGHVFIYAPFAEKVEKQLPVTVLVPPQRFVIVVEP